MGNGEKRILVVEDDAAVRRLMAAALSRAGLAVVEATDSQEAIEILRGDGVDAIVLDLMILPHGGSSVLAWMEAEQPSLLHRTIIVSAATLQEIERAVTGRPCRAIPKPFDLDELVGAVLGCAGIRTAGDLHPG